MATAFIMTFDRSIDDAAAGYDAVIEDMDLGGRVPEGARWHVAGPYGDGGWRVIDVWDDSEAFGRFAQERIGPLTAQHGLPQPDVESVELTDVRQADPDAPGFAQVVRLPLDEDGFATLSRRAMPDGHPPYGAVWHVSGPGRTGGTVVVNTWRDRAARDAFFGARIRPNLPAGVQVDPEELDVHNSLG